MYRKQMLLKSLVSISLVALISCSNEQSAANSAPSDRSTQNIQTSQAATVPAAIPASTTPASNSGVVKSIHNAAGYSYIEVDIKGDTFWMAAPISAVKPGDKIAWSGYAMMSNFTSKSLKRTFEQIMFVDRVGSAEALAARGHQGTVLETMNSAGYSYIQVDESGKKIWIAAPVANVMVGQIISWNSGAPMQNFPSNSLNRTFEEIFFVGGFQIVSG